MTQTLEGAPLAGNLAAPGERFAFIHGLRGLAALLVVWSHLSGFWLLENGKTSELQNAWYEWIVAPFNIFQNGGHLGVILFFLISGYLITHTSLRESRWSFVIKRTLRIFPPVMFATCVTWLFLQLAEATGTNLLGVSGGSALHWFASLFLLDGFTPGARALDVTWTLVIELIFYTLTFILLGASRKNELRATWTMTGLWVVVVLVSFANPYLHSTANGGLAPFVAFLILGRVIYLWQQKRITPASAATLGVLVATLYGTFLEANSPGFLLAPGGWTGAAPLVSYIYALVIFLGMMQLQPKTVVQPFKMLGDISYSLYLLHIPIGITVLNLLDKWGVATWANTLIAIAVSIAASYVAYRLVEKPSQQLARKILARTPKVSVPAGAP